MLNLIRNELTKVFSKVSTYVILGILVLAALGWGALWRIISEVQDDYYYETTYEMEYEYQLEWAKEERKSYEPGTYRYIRLTRDIMMYEILIEYTTAYPEEKVDWAYDACTEWLDEVIGVDKEHISPDGFATVEEIWKTEFEETDQVYITQELYDEHQKKQTMLKEWLKNNDWKGFYTALANEPGLPEKRAEMFRALLDDGVNPADYSHWLVMAWMDYYYNYYEVEQYEENIKAGWDISEKEYEAAKARRDASWYRIENNVEVCVQDGSSSTEKYYSESLGWNAFYLSAGMVSFLGILMVIIAGGIVAGEFSNGTIKFLLINPTKRQKIFWSKFITLMLVVTFATMTLLVLSTLSIVLFFGGDVISMPYIHTEAGKVFVSSSFSLIFEAYVRHFVEAVVLSVIAFSISSIFRSSGVAIGISIGVFTMGSTITSVLAMMGQDWGRYLIFANMDPLGMAESGSLFPHHSVTTCVIVLVVHLFLFLLTARDAFVRREV